ncbi:MAG: hypothetical protein FWD74_01640, partial [Actinomycetia bacterium]|nr:hypothetical protein [Actinomycetes bacterium]
ARSLQLREQLVERIGGPQELRDLSVSLDNLGRVQEAGGDWGAAESRYARSLQLLERLDASGTLLTGDSAWLAALRGRAAAQGNGEDSCDGRDA